MKCKMKIKKVDETQCLCVVHECDTGESKPLVECLFLLCFQGFADFKPPILRHFFQVLQGA